MNLIDTIKVIDRSLLEDDRGWFLKVLNGKEKELPAHTGEIYMTMAKPGAWRANHYHPVTSEWFTVFKGTAKVILEDIISKERLILEFDGNKPQTLFVPPGIAHVFINNSKEEDMLLVVYAANLYDPSDTVLYNLMD